MPLFDDLHLTALSLRNLQEQQKNQTDANPFTGLWAERPKLVLSYSLGVFVFIAVCYCILREIVLYKWGREFYPWRRTPQQRFPERRRRHLATEIDCEALEDTEAIIALRMERRQKYLQFLAPYTMVVKSEDLYYSVDNADGTREIHQLKANDQNARTDTELMDNGETGDQIDVEAANHTFTHSACMEDTRQRLVKIPSSKTGQHHRYVDGSCSICLLDYNVGDAVIRSTRIRCPHAFHDECILSWLSKGKKRCPMCRHFFVPGAKVDGKKFITHDVNDLSSGGSRLFGEDEEQDENADECTDENADENTEENTEESTDENDDEEEMGIEDDYLVASSQDDGDEIVRQPAHANRQTDR